MADSRRRQNHSCDPCRKGKRGCDAPENRAESSFTSCSNCKRWKKKCTFNWVASRRMTSSGQGSRSRTKPSTSGITAAPAPAPGPTSAIATPDSSDVPALLGSYNALVDEGLLSYQPAPFSFSEPPNASDLDSPSDWQINNPTQASEDFFSPLDQTAFHLLQNVGTYDVIQQLEDKSTSSSSENRNDGSLQERGLCLASDKTATKYACSTMSRNLIRIYHDSMENALSCWLTEHNCPYTDPISYVLPSKQAKEWGPSWSNRMCLRVCRLDRVSSSLRGRALSAEEDKAAARALHLAIVAFASQWTQHAQSGTALSVPEDITLDERSIRKNTWNEARHVLQHSTGIPSFRVIFANIIFSLTQAPLDTRNNTTSLRLSQLLDNDGAPVFLETANRQLYTFRHKFARLQREAPPSVAELSRRRGSTASTLTEILEMPPMPPTETSISQVDPILANQDHQSTLSLLFWLGIMFDTLSSAMYQRPLVVSDEDSQIATASPLPLDSELEYEAPINLDCFEIPQQRTNHPNRIEQSIQRALGVYNHWTSTYQPFMLDCVNNHGQLPSRLQSWYVILDGHWHLAAMLLADVLEDIDRSGLGTDNGRQARRSTDLISTLKIENALAVGSLARSSLHDPNSISLHRHFHDSLNEVAFLVEPWTVVLIHSFAKAAYISLGYVDIYDIPVSTGETTQGNCEYLGAFAQNCNFCIRALQYLGRKSDMASLVSRDLVGQLGAKVAGLA
ncbi:Zn(II)2Cys6 transcription factor domain-containing protein [Aspergillus undulatus]|uniref:Zn(II)2Cys6 transcription factor domain-containing protein n=1 Tax=Aspergillus undulatus TaxID=1810928 RepID=UPI003CCCDE2E